MGSWVEGWLGGWVDGWMGGWVGQMGGWKSWLSVNWWTFFLNRIFFICCLADVCILKSVGSILGGKIFSNFQQFLFNLYQTLKKNQRNTRSTGELELIKIMYNFQNQHCYHKNGRVHILTYAVLGYIYNLSVPFVINLFHILDDDIRLHTCCQ